MARRPHICLALAAGCLAVGTLAAPTAAVASTPCEAAGFSRRFHTDRTAFCASADTRTGEFVLTRSRDGGRSWQERGRIRAPRDEHAVGTSGVLLSPDYDVDRIVYVTTTQGLLVWNDATGRGSLAETLAIEPFRAVAFSTGPTPGLNHSVVFQDHEELFARAYDSATGVLRYVPAAGSGTRAWFVPPDFATRRQAVAIAIDSPVSTDGAFDLNAYRCTDALVCEEPTYSFGHVLDVNPGALPDGTVYLGTQDWGTYRSRVWRSSDSGVTWTEWASLNKILVPIDKARRGSTTVFLTASADAPKRLFARLVTHGDRSAYPSEQLFRSDNAGTTWRRIGYSLDSTQPGSARGNLPFAAGADPTTQAPAYYGYLSAERGGRLYAIGASVGAGKRQSVLFCSPDLGVRWYRTC